MALDLTSLTRRDLIGRVGNGPGSAKYEWGYATNDLPAVSDAAGYFNSAYQALTVGDVIRCINGAGAAATPTTKVYCVTAINLVTGVVTVA